MAQWPSNSDLLPKPQGFTHASIADTGKLVHFADQITQALANITTYIVGWNESMPSELVKGLTVAGTATQLWSK